MTFARRRLFTARRVRLLGVLLVVMYVVAQFAAFRASLDRVPASWTLAGTSFAGQPIDEVVALMQAAFDEPVILHYRDELRALPPGPNGWEWTLDPSSGQIVSSYVRHRYQVRIDGTNQLRLQRFRERSQQTGEGA